jgi:hypothetical protein
MISTTRFYAFKSSINLPAMSHSDLFSVVIPASVSAGLAARLLCHPLDTCKARIQAAGSTYRNLFDAIGRTVASEGIQGLYRGLPVAAIGSAPAVCVYISGFEFSRDQLLKTPFFAKIPAAADFTAGMLAETLSCIIFVPVDVMKERLQIQRPSTEASANHPGLRNYSGSVDALRTILKEEGVRGIYKGYGATLFSFGPFSACYFLFYEQLKKYARGSNGADATLNPWLSLACSASAGALASVLTNPLDLVKLRLQVQRRANLAGMASEGVVYKGLVDGLLTVMRSEGWRGMLRGAGARVAFHVPNTACTFALYEHCKAYFAGRA